MNTIELIITLVVVSLCSSILAGTIVYYLLDKKLKKESDWLRSRIWDNCKAIDNFYEKFQEHMYKYHK